MKGPWSKQLSKKKNRGFPGATLAFYGPDDRHATKAVVGIFLAPDSELSEMRKWFGKELDVRVDREIGMEILAYLREHHIRSVAVKLEIFGCPHEEGVDYPNGEVCPECPFWATHDRFTGESLE
jgi:hypothetical protein